ncbi:MAG: AsmA family protein, partial [Bacteroidales bacterium]|nr:AsmA family protein [Bacteroidales bacterium]
MRKIIKKALRILMWAILTCIVLLVALFFLVQNSRIQTFLAQKAASYLSRELETRVYIEKLKIVFPLDIDIKNFGIDDRRGATILRTEKLQLSLTSLSRRDHNINIGRVAFENPEINLLTYEGDSLTNYQFIINYFASGEPDTTISAPWSFSLRNASISNASFAMHNFNFEPEPDFLDFNHLQLQGLHLVLSDLQYFNDTLNVQLHHLSANEHSGIVLNRLRADLSLTPEGIFTKNLVIQTPNSDLLLDLAFLFNDFSAFSYFTDSVTIHADIYHSELDLSDLAGFVPELAGMDSKVAFEGQVRGEVNSLRLKDFALSYGSFTSFRGNINMDGLPNIEETFIHLNAKKLTTHYTDLQTLKLPSQNGPRFLALPEEVKQLGHVIIKGRFTGFYTDFVSDGSFSTNLGTLTTDISLKYNFDNRKIVYAGQVDTRQFNLGRFLDKEEILGFINMKATVDGHGQFPSTFNAKFTADVFSFDFMGNNIDSLIVTGELLEKKFNGNLAIRDELLSLDFLGLFDLNHDPPVFNFSAVLNDAYLAQLNLIERDSSARLSTKVELDFTGNNLDNLQGHILINETRYYEKGEMISIDTFDLNALPVNAGKRVLALRSDYMDADIEGNFNYSEIYPAFRNILRFYLPSFEEDETLADTEVPEQSFTYYVTLKNTQDISQLFLPDVVVNTNAIIEGRFNSSENIVGIAAKAGDISLYGTTLKDWKLTMNATSQNLYVRTGAGRLQVIDSENGETPEIGLDNLLIDANFAGDSIVYNIAWRDPDDPQANSGDLSGFFTFVNNPQLELRITESAFTVNSTSW